VVSSGHLLADVALLSSVSGERANRSRLFQDDLRQTEGAKIACGKAHFKALMVRECRLSTSWRRA
jgi:hypothetical protein